MGSPLGTPGTLGTLQLDQPLPLCRGQEGSAAGRLHQVRLCTNRLGVLGRYKALSVGFTGQQAERGQTLGGLIAATPEPTSPQSLACHLNKLFLTPNLPRAHIHARGTVTEWLRARARACGHAGGPLSRVPCACGALPSRLLCLAKHHSARGRVREKGKSTSVGKLRGSFSGPQYSPTRLGTTHPPPHF